MVTHPRPVFAAIWFVVVVVCSAGLFLLLDAEFMAFSLIIVYAGAILITYLFVIMLAQEATGTAGEALYDRLPREPIAALVVGFVLLASIGDALLVVDGVKPGETAVAGDPGTLGRARRTAEAAPGNRRGDLRPRPRPGETAPTEVRSPRRRGRHGFAGGKAMVKATVDGTERTVELPATALPSNTQQVGWALVAVFPGSRSRA